LHPGNEPKPSILSLKFRPPGSAEDPHLLDGDSEPRAPSIRLGEVLQFAEPRKVRQLVERNAPELEQYGSLARRVTRAPSAR
jgi:hypothetical protein